METDRRELYRILDAFEQSNAELRKQCEALRNALDAALDLLGELYLMGAALSQTTAWAQVRATVKLAATERKEDRRAMWERRAEFLRTLAGALAEVEALAR